MIMDKRFLTIAASGVLVIGLALCGVQANAQSGSSEGHRRGRRHQMSPDQQLQRLSETLSLTDDQKGQIRPILEDRHQKMQSIRSESSLSRQERISKMRSIFEESDNKIRAVLNDDQKQKFDEMRQQRRERMQKRGGTDNK
jgi:periplasmic protein CpxP/Spy